MEDEPSAEQKQNLISTRVSKIATGVLRLSRFVLTSQMPFNQSGEISEGMFVNDGSSYGGGRAAFPLTSHHVAEASLF